MSIPASNPSTPGSPATPAAPVSDQGAMPATTEATLLLRRAAAGDRLAAEQLLPLVYEQMRALAGSQFAGQPGAKGSGGRAGHTLQPTALVHEAYVRLIRSPENILHGGYESRGHFMAVAAMAMRQILTDHARRKRAAKRGGGEAMGERVDFTIVEATVPAGAGGSLNRSTPLASGIDIEQLDDALTELERNDPRRHRVVCLRFFGGMDVAEVANVMCVSLSTVEADWRSARAWLSVKLKQ